MDLRYPLVLAMRGRKRPHDPHEHPHVHANAKKSAWPTLVPTALGCESHGQAGLATQN